MILKKLVNVKLIWCIFEKLSGLKITFYESEIFWFVEAKEEENKYKQIFGCGFRSLPFKYLGILIHYQKLLNT
jgi:hypothetical protein